MTSETTSEFRTPAEERADLLVALQNRNQSEQQARRALAAATAATNDAIVDCRERDVPWKQIRAAVNNIHRSAAWERYTDARARRRGNADSGVSAPTDEDPVLIELAAQWGGQMRPLDEFQALRLSARLGADAAAAAEKTACATEVRRDYETRDLVERTRDGAISAARHALARQIRQHGETTTLDAWTIVASTAGAYRPPWRTATESRSTPNP